MSDIFREVDEEVRRDEMKVLWDRYGVYLIAACCAVILGVGGYKAWQAYAKSTAESAGSSYSQALELAQAKKSDDAFKAFKSLSENGPSGYAALASFQIAAANAKAGRSGEAVSIYDALAANTGLDDVLRGFARIRAGFALLDDGKPADVERRVAVLNAAGNPWRNSAREILALVAYKSGKLARAERFYNDILSDSGAPGGLRQRAQVMISLIAPDLATTEKAKKGKAPKVE